MHLVCPVMQIAALDGNGDDCSLLDCLQIVRCLELEPHLPVFYLAVIREMEHDGINTVIAFRLTKDMPFEQDFSLQVVLAEVLDNMLPRSSFPPRMVVAFVP